jgi:hypothetical protein
MSILQFSAIQPVFVQSCTKHSQELYSQALVVVQQKSFIIRSLICNNSRASFLTALALPGIMRAIRFSNLLKIKFIEWKYVHFGHLPVDYTVGDLQMRLSIVEEIEQYLKSHPQLQSRAGLLLYRQIPEKNIRYIRLKRMYSIEWQLRYLCAFDVIMRHLYSKTGFDDVLQKLRFYAHVYYHGSLFKQEESLESISDATVSAIKSREAEYAVQFYLHDAKQTLW